MIYGSTPGKNPDGWRVAPGHQRVRYPRLRGKGRHHAARSGTISFRAAVIFAFSSAP